MAPTKSAKLVQAQLPGSFLKVTKGSGVEKPRASKKTSTKRAATKKQDQRVDEKTQSLLPGAADPEIAPPAPAANSVLTDGGEEAVGFGTHQAVCKVLNLKKHSSTFFAGKIPDVDKTEDGFTEYRRQAESFPVVRESIVVRCEDGPPLLYLIKGGMRAGFSADEQHALETKSLGAIRSLTTGYKPNVPGKKDSRAKADSREQQRRWNAKGKPFGRYNLIFNYGIGQTHKDPNIHREGQPKGAKAMASLSKYIREIVWEHEQVSKWISVLDPKKHKELHDCYQNLGVKDLKHLYQGPNACHSGLVLLVNQSVKPHKDKKDARDNWTTTNTHAGEVGGKYEGGHLVLNDLGIKIAQEPGDLLLTHAAVLTHYIEEILEGERFCHVRFTKIDILNRPKPTPDLGIVCPIPGCTRKPCRNWSGLTRHLQGPGGKRGATATRKAYHFLPRDEVKQRVEQMKVEYESSASESQNSVGA